MGRVRVWFTAVALLAVAGAVAGQGTGLGPKDGLDLPPTDTGRVKVGDVAPDFSLRSLAGPTIALSDYRGAKNVVLVFYRGHW